MWYCKRKLADLLEEVRQKWNNVDKELWYKREQKLKRLEQGMICNDMRANIELGEHLTHILPLLRRHNQEFLKEKYKLTEKGLLVKVGKQHEAQLEETGTKVSSPKRGKAQAKKKKKRKGDESSYSWTESESESGSETQKRNKQKKKKAMAKRKEKEDGDNNDSDEDDDDDDDDEDADDDRYARKRVRQRRIGYDNFDGMEDDVPIHGDDAQEKYQDLLDNNINEQLDKKRERTKHNKAEQSTIDQLGDSNQTLFAEETESSDDAKA